MLIALSISVACLVSSLPPVAHLQRENPGTTSLMLQREAEARASGRPPRRMQKWLSLRFMSERLIQAVLMGEDAGFFGHQGFDFYEIRDSIQKNIERKRFARGGSTISQQLAKNLFLSTEKTLLRKLKEAILTYRLERDISKRRILEIYLNVIEWGDGVYGAEAAAETYFGKPCTDLDPAEAALLAAMIPNPRRLNPVNRMKFLKIRQEEILRRMWRAGYLADEEYQAAKSKPFISGWPASLSEGQGDVRLETHP